MDMTEKDFFLLNLSATYALTPALSLWVRGENILAQGYEVNYGFPMPRATLMSGVKMSF